MATTDALGRGRVTLAMTSWLANDVDWKRVSASLLPFDRFLDSIRFTPLWILEWIGRPRSQIRDYFFMFGQKWKMFLRHEKMKECYLLSVSSIRESNRLSCWWSNSLFIHLFGITVDSCAASLAGIYTTIAWRTVSALQRFHQIIQMIDFLFSTAVRAFGIAVLFLRIFVMWCLPQSIRGARKSLRSLVTF